VPTILVPSARAVLRTALAEGTSIVGTINLEKLFLLIHLS